MEKPATIKDDVFYTKRENRLLKKSEIIYSFTVNCFSDCFLWIREHIWLLLTVTRKVVLIMNINESVVLQYELEVNIIVEHCTVAHKGFIERKQRRYIIRFFSYFIWTSLFIRQMHFTSRKLFRCFENDNLSI